MRVPARLARRRGLRILLGGAPAYPVLALAILYALDQVDLAAFGVVLPQMRLDLHFSFTDIFWLSLPAGLLGWLVVIAGGQLGDRFNRVRLSTVAAAGFAITSILTGAVTSFGQLVALRSFNQVGGVNQPLHNSLIADLYPKEGRGVAMGIWSGLRPVGLLTGSLAAGFLTAAFNWRLAFVVLCIPATVGVVMMLRVPEPVRGGQEFDAATAAHASALHLGPVQSMKALWNIRSYRRLMLSSAVLGLGAAALLPLSVFFFQGVFGIGPVGIGLVSAGNAAVVFGGSVVAGALLQRMSPSRVALLNGLLISVAGLGYLFMALAPTAELATACYMLSGAAYGVFSVATFLQLAAVVPANLRSMGFAGSGLLFIVGGLWAPVALGLAESAGLRIAILASFGWYVVAGLMVAGSNRFMERDIARATVILEAEAEARRRRASGEKVELLEVGHLDVSYGTVQVLFDVSMTVHDGEVVALLGTNGAGKSTLLRTISGLIRPTEGVVLYQGSDITGLDAEVITKRGVIHVPGGRGVFPGLTVRRNLRLGTYLYRADPAYREESMEHALQLFPRLRERLDQPAGNLSGGEQQMLNLAQAVMARPRLLLIDELSLGLAPKVVEELLQVVESIAASGVTIVLVEQSVNIALTLATRAYFMEKGEVRFEGRTADLADRDDLVRSVFLAGAR